MAIRHTFTKAQGTARSSLCTQRNRPPQSSQLTERNRSFQSAERCCRRRPPETEKQAIHPSSIPVPGSARPEKSRETLSAAQVSPCSGASRYSFKNATVYGLYYPPLVLEKPWVRASGPPYPGRCAVLQLRRRMRRGNLKRSRSRSHSRGADSSRLESGCVTTAVACGFQCDGRDGAEIVHLAIFPIVDQAPG